MKKLSHPLFQAVSSLTEAKGKAKVSAGQTAVSRSYGYDRTGNLTHSTDQRSGTTHFEYDKLGRITQAGNERFAFDPAHNILSDGLKGKAVTDNRISEYNGTSYYYDDFGNLIHRELPNGEVQNCFYDLHDQLIKVEIFKKDGTKETWVYTYDALGRRISKGRLKEDSGVETLSDGLEDKREFVWDGSHLLQEVYANGRYTYIYTDVDSYEPLAQIHNYTNAENETYQEINYFHCDQIGIPREMTDREGKLLWFGDYAGWGKLKSETNIADAHQPFRLQNQYFDRETGLHYNFFRYYDPDVGRFVNQDPIGLWGGMNPYRFSPNVQVWVDYLGLNPVNRVTGQAVQRASQLPITRPGTQGWQQAVEALKKEGRGDIRVANMEDAKKLMKDAELNMDRRKMYTSTPYERGYEVHKPQPGKDRQGNYCKAKERWEKGESDVGNDLPHIKWKKPGKQGQGHIFFED